MTAPGTRCPPFSSSNSPLHQGCAARARRARAVWHYRPEPAPRETVGSTGTLRASVPVIASLSHDGGLQVLVQLDPNATSRPDDPGRSPERERVRLRVEPWTDPVIDEVGHDPRSGYVETFWLPVLGPSATWLLRHLTIRLEESPGGIDLDLEDMARSLGLGERLGPNAPFARTLKRCVDFDMAEWRGPRLLAVRLRLPPLARRHIRRLPESLQAQARSGATGKPACTGCGEPPPARLPAGAQPCRSRGGPTDDRTTAATMEIPPGARYRVRRLGRRRAGAPGRGRGAAGLLITERLGQPARTPR